MAKHPFRRTKDEPDPDPSAAASTVGNADGANDSPPVESSATATQPEPTMKPKAIVGPLSSIGPSELLDLLEASKTGKAKIAAGRAYVEANPMCGSERMVEVLGSNPRDRAGAGTMRTVGYWPAGTVRKATKILQASPAK